MTGDYYSNDSKMKAGNHRQLFIEIHDALFDGIIKRWYPLVIDWDAGGYFTNVDSDWNLPDNQEKMIVSQARHIWSLSRLSTLYENDAYYRELALHGLPFLQNKMWDKKHGGFYQIRDRKGNQSDAEGWGTEKRAYGNAFAIYGLSALFGVTGNKGALDLAKQTFQWLEEHAWDDESGGYFQFLDEQGRVIDDSANYRGIASDKPELGFKDQNSSIHLLEAFTELITWWPHPVLKKRLKQLLEIIRDKMTNEKGYLHLFFNRDFKPVTTIHHPDQYSPTDYRLDHISFGHDYETAFLMLEASHALGLTNDEKTLTTAKKMVDHSIEFGFDRETGGFFDGGHYFGSRLEILKKTKNWWAQAEALNILMLMTEIYPEDTRYIITFHKQWDYVKKYVLDAENGDWFEGGLDEQPHFKTGPKSHMWKCTYHTGRALTNLMALLAHPDFPEISQMTGLMNNQQKMKHLIDHWKRTAGTISEKHTASVLSV